jgi:transposase InsO family protein
VRFAFIAQHAEEFPVDLMCEVLGVSRSGYYAWRDRPLSATALRREQLVEQIRTAHAESRQVYGSPRIRAELRAQGVVCSENTVAKLMRQHGIRSKRRQRFVVRTTDSRHPHPVADNRLNQQFAVPRPDEAWAADITYIPTGEGWLYLATIMDLCSRKIVGWAADDHLRAELTCHALQRALVHRRPKGPVLHHSDRGVQYACDEYQALLACHGLTCSMSRTGNCYDNAVVESFFGTLKTELTHHDTYATRNEARLALFEYLEVFYNRKRRHSALDYRSPAEYEATFN